MEKLTNQFQVVSQDGKARSVYEYTEIIDTSSMDGASSILGRKRLVTDNDEPVNFQNGKFIILGTFEEIQCVEDKLR